MGYEEYGVSTIGQKHQDVVSMLLSHSMCSSHIRYFLLHITMPMHAERDIVMANPTVCPSHSGIVSK